jgi:hypothetical protein
MKVGHFPFRNSEALNFFVDEEETVFKTKSYSIHADVLSFLPLNDFCPPQTERGIGTKYCEQWGTGTHWHEIL